MAELELPAASVALVRKHARVVVGRAGLGASERADVEQELTARLLGGWPQYRPARGHPLVFCEVVVGRAAAMMLREYRATKRGREKVILACDIDRHDPDERVDPADDCRGRELRADVAAEVAALPRELREVAERLREQSCAAAARDLGISRATLGRRVERLRERFAARDLDAYLSSQGGG
ncbi:RNA polymerase sigma factor [Fimbriiglobus ruber]|uniref:Uncharacterized protein n=1 Tax=Fimbriiglobus ruber TaxID=1908690 RepID=A0A225DUX2_9BACT|nr:sigma-70 family RNA polymerase sigma factor [Fimbriiglobus ruber]OWK39947.1 hypothetical protein FRUB_05837 [Fimbriiglobus ruber]